MSQLSQFLSFLESNLEVDLIPVAQGALAIVQKNPSVAGVLAAKLYVVGNAPVALVQAETSIVQGAINVAATDLAGVLASAEAKVAGTAKAA